jgi:hypothetical protein
MTGATDTGTPERTGDPRFTLGLTLDVAAVLEAHGYGPVDPDRFVELEQHLFCLLHRGPGDRCVGRGLAQPGAQR